MNAAYNQGQTVGRAGYCGEGRHRNPLKNHRSPKYVSAISTAAPPAIQHIRKSFGFAPLRIHSLKSHLRSVVAASVASIVLARPSFADADREGV